MNVSRHVLKFFFYFPTFWNVIIFLNIFFSPAFLHLWRAEWVDESGREGEGRRTVDTAGKKNGRGENWGVRIKVIDGDQNDTGNAVTAANSPKITVFNELVLYVTTEFSWLKTVNLMKLPYDRPTILASFIVSLVNGGVSSCGILWCRRTPLCRRRTNRSVSGQVQL